MERLKTMKEQLMSTIEGQMGNLHNVDTKEMGEAIDMVKDLSEAIYYCTVTKAMEDKDKQEEYKMKVMQEMQQQQPQVHYYTIPPFKDYPYDDMDIKYRDMDRDWGRMYYGPDGGNARSMGGTRGGRMGGRRNYLEPDPDVYGNDYQMNMRDAREGRSPITRRNYIEAKEMHQTKEMKLKELEKYIQELGTDITEMIQDASPEEKQLLSSKISALATKIK